MRSNGARADRAGAGSRGRVWALGGLIIAAIAVTAGLMVGRSPARASARARVDDPERFIAAALDLIETDRPERLTDLVHAESPEMRAVLDRVGRAFAAAADLSRALAERFPDDTRRLAEGALAATPGGVFAADGPPDDAFAALLADPFGWLRDAARRVEVVYLSDAARAITIDGRPALGVGVTLKPFDAGWQIALPTTLPALDRFMPASPEQWSIVGSMATVAENALRDLAREVRGGRVRSIEDTARRMGELAAGPLLMTWIAYQRAREADASPADVR